MTTISLKETEELRSLIGYNFTRFHHYDQQWRIQDFPEDGGGASTNDFAKFSLNCMKLKEFGPGANVLNFTM